MKNKARPPTLKCRDCLNSLHANHNPDGSCNNSVLRHSSENGKEVKIYCDCKWPQKEKTP